MANFWKKATENWQDGVTLLLGLWLFASAWILSLGDVTAAFWNAVIFGAVVAASAAAAIVKFNIWEEVVDMAIGVWLIAVPWIFGFAATATVATWNFALVGLAILALSAWSLRSHTNHGHMA